MANNKQQHFVPKCHLKPFSLGGEGAAINLYSIGLDRSIPNAPVKGQSAKTYFYGKDPQHEDAIQKLEGEYARVVRALHEELREPTDAEFDSLLAFVVLQYVRTDMAARREALAAADMMEVVREGALGDDRLQDISTRELLAMSLGQLHRHWKYVEDLSRVILINRTDHEFVTSDDPAILTNRYHLQRLKIDNFGITNSGTLWFLPLSPNKQLVFYDAKAYTIPSKTGAFVSVSSCTDVFALNELQYIKAGNSVYFSDWGARDRIEQEFRESASRRPESWSRVIPCVEEPSLRIGERIYRVATQEERKARKVRMVNTQSVFPSPSRWFSHLKFRDPVRTYYEGTGMGRVRKKEWLRSDDT